MFKKVYLIFALSMMVLPSAAQDRKDRWVDSIMQRLSVAEKIGQLWMIPVSSYWTGELAEKAEEGIKDFGAGGLYITKGGPLSTAAMINRLQRLSKVPLFAAMEAEWGLGQTLDSAMTFPRPLALGAIRNDSLIYRLGTVIAEQMKLVGVQMNFAPRADQYRKGLPPEFFYSDQHDRGAALAVQFMRGLQDHGVMAVSKQFPKGFGKGDAAHDTLMFMDLDRLDSSEMETQIKLIQQGIHGLLTSNFSFTLKGRKKPVPAAASAVFINDILKTKLKFQGLTFAEIPVLIEFTEKNKKGDAELLAFEIGNDVLINPQNPAAAVKKIKKAVKKNPALLNQLNNSVRKILGAKYETGLADASTIEIPNMMRRLAAPEVELFRHQLAEAAVTVVRNEGAVLPVASLENKIFVSLSVGERQSEFDEYLSRYAQVKRLRMRSPADTVWLADSLKNADVVILGIYKSGAAFQKQISTILRKWSSAKTVIVCDFGNPENLTDWKYFPVVMEAYSEKDLMPKVAAQIIFGGMGSLGVLPMDIDTATPAGTGISTATQDRLSYTLPEAARMDSRVLEKIETIAWEAILNKATPGCRVLVAKDGKVVYDKSFGYLTYENKSPVREETIYDLASVTKVSATLQTVMFMQEKGLIDLNKKISVYLPEFKGSNKEDFIVKDILTHQAGLWPFLPFWTRTMKDTVYLPEFYSHTESEEYPYQVSRNLFASRGMKDSLWQWIIDAKIVDKVNRLPYDFRYSDMGFYIMQHLAEKILNQPMQDFLDQNLYEPLGAYTTGFLPLKRFPESQIAPTEDDKLFRKSLLAGYVHDQGAAMQGGVAGHAGLFSAANDMAKLGQLWLQGGHYGGHQYYKPETLELFTRKQYENSRRGLGWDRPTASDPDGVTTIYASQKTFGHTGFTGTCIWVDPEFNLIYIFLSNRVHPNMNNNKITNIRPRIQSVIYQSIFSYCEGRH